MANNRLLLADYLQGVGGEKNFIVNPSGFKNVVKGITLVNSATATRNTTTPLTEISDIQVGFTAVNDEAQLLTNTLDNALNGQNCELKFDYTLGTTTTIVAKIYQNSVVVSTTILDATKKSFTTNIPCGDLSGATKVGFAQTVGATTNTLHLANVYYGKATNIGPVAQAQWMGSLSYTGVSACTWATASTSFANFSADSDCPTAAVAGVFNTTAGKIPGGQATNLPPGRYKAVVTYNPQKAGTVDDLTYYRLTDGTTNSQGQIVYFGTNQTWIVPGTLEFTFEYTSAQSAVTFQMQGRSANASNTANIWAGNASAGFQIDLYRYPTSSELAVRTDQSGITPWVPTVVTGSWTTNTTYTAYERRVGDTMELMVNVALTGAPNAATDLKINMPSGRVIDSAKLPGLSFFSVGTAMGLSGGSLFMFGVDYDTTTRVRVESQMFASSNDHQWFATGTTLPRTYGNGDLVNINIKVPIVGWTYTQPAPILVGSITSGNTGALRDESIILTAGSPTCTIVWQSGTAFSAPTSNQQGDCSLTMAGWSQKPACTAQVANFNGDAGRYTVSAHLRSLSQTAMRVQGTANDDTTDVADAISDAEIHVRCVGPRS